MTSPDRPSARDRAAEVIAAELFGHLDRATRPAVAAEIIDALLARPEVLRVLAGTPHPGVTRLLARCDEADAAARRGNHTPAGGLVPAIEIRALLGHTPTDHAPGGQP